MEFFKEATRERFIQTIEKTEEIHQQKTLIETPLDTLVHPVASIGNTLLKC